MIDAPTLLRAADAVLLDFDGPVTPLMPNPTNIATAEAGRAALRRRAIVVPNAVMSTSDHLAVIRWAGHNAPEALPDVEAACLASELAAAETCVPTPGAHDLLAMLQQDRIPVVIVSNNAAEAIRAYLARHQIAGLVRDVVGRPVGAPDLMKPNTYLVDEALRILDAMPASAVLIGDSVSDVEVARAAGVRSIGYAKNPHRGRELAAAGADSITSTITALAAPANR